MPIMVLEPRLASKIAAGEVIERPVSVVKELMENSLDAGASRITVEIHGGGVQELRVVDDAQGIPAPEVELAFQHHATSKLDSPDQLDSIATLGFRGEALPSIAAVSQMTLTSRPREAPNGHQVHYQWGRQVGQGPQGCPPGTAVTVKDLFGNLPARRKFLRSNSAETARIRELIDRYALVYPEVSFNVVSEGRTLLSSPGNGRPEEALLAVYGPEIASGMLQIGEPLSAIFYGINGFVSSPAVTRSNRSYMNFFVNRRWTQNRMLSFALEEAYHGLLPEKRYPLAVVNLDIPFSDVDVNCHPSKREVRFRDESRAYTSLQRAVRAALVAETPVPTVDLGAGGHPHLTPPSPSTTAGGGFFWSPFDGRAANPGGTPTGPVPTGAPSSFAGITPLQALPSLRVVGQVRSTYIVAEGPDGMFLVDQHAAHERVLFDRIVKKAEEKSPESQPLLAPETVELSAAQLEVVQNHQGFLADYGFILESFGQNSFLLRAVPSIMTGQDPARSLVDILDMVAFEGLLRKHDDVLAASIACHSAIRAGKSLTEPEMRALLEQLEATANPHTCPHGRPTLVHFSEYQMEREFGRR